MKHFLWAGLIGAALLQCGCQSMNWSANNKSSSKSTVAQNENVREVPWSWNKKKASAASEIPPEIAAKFEKGKLKSANSKTAAEWVNEGARQEMAHDLGAAKKSYESALDVDPDCADAHHRLGILADMNSDYSAAQAHYESALRQKPSDANLLSDIGYSNYLRGNTSQGERYLVKALEIDAKHGQALKNLGTLYASQNRYDDALATFRRFRKDDSQQLMTRFFPHGRPIPNGSDAQQVASQEATDGSGKSGLSGIDQASLDRMSREELNQLVGRLLQQETGRNQALAEVSPGNSVSSTETDRSNWPEISAANPNRATTQGQRSSAGFDAAVQPVTTTAATSHLLGQDPKNEMPFWEGTPRQSRATKSEVSPAISSTGAAVNVDFTSNARNQPISANLQPSVAEGDIDPSWWTIETGPNQAERIASTTASNDSGWNVEGVPPSSSASSAGTSANSAARGDGASAPNNNQWAYQLGMNAGPGTLFPVVANYTPNAPQSSSVKSPTGFPATRTTSPMGDSGSGNTENPPWQATPADPSPRSSTENFGTPTSVPWPENTTTQTPRQRFNRVAQGTAMPVITPAGAPATANKATASAGRRSSPDDIGIATASGKAIGTNSAIVPAWYDRPAANRSTARGPSAANRDSESWPSDGQ